MKKEEMIKILRESNALNVKKAEDTIQNIDSKEVKDAKVAQGITGLDSELPTQKAIEKEVNKDTGPVVPADKDGVSKNGGDSDKMEPGKVEAERKKEDNGMKDIINVSSRKVDEASEVNNELLNQLKEAQAREAGYQAKIAKMKTICEEALDKQADMLSREHAKEMESVFEAVIAEGEKMEKELTEASVKNERLYNKAKKLYESSLRLNKILLEAVKKAQPAPTMVRYTTTARRIAESLSK